jgi:hypothetical protein
MASKADIELDDVAIKQLMWKPGPMRTAAVSIVRAALENRTFWPDTLGLEETIGSKDKNCIGSAFRILIKTGIIRKTGDWRQSRQDDSRGRTVFEYTLSGSAGLARSFLRANDVEPPKEQGELTLSV